MRFRFLVAAIAIVLLLVGSLLAMLAIQKSNVELIVAEGLDNRLLPHAVNTSGSLAATLDAGLRSMEIDLFFISKGTDGYFVVQHDKAGAEALKLEQYLKALKGYQVKKIWFDVKNIDEKNSSAVLAELRRLDALYGISNYAIVESSFQSGAMRKFREAGFHTSYYLPIGQIRQLLAAGESGALRAQAEEIAALLRREQSAAVSFHLDLYPFVKHYLEPVIDTHVVYHTWASIRLYYPYTFERLQQADYFVDPRVKTILYDTLPLLEP